ncbi:MAG: hypothetical protein ACRD94_03710 [Nitrosopumilaceae archaeon]
MEFILIIISLMILLVPGFDESVPPTGDKTFKIEYSDNVQSIKTISDQSLAFWGFDIKLKQNSGGILDIKIPKNFPVPASFSNAWNSSAGSEPIVMKDGVEISYNTIEEPCYFHYKIPVEDMANLEIAYPLILAGTWQLYSTIQFDENHPCYQKVFDIKRVSSPLKQIKTGIKYHNVQCNDGLVLAQRGNTERSACVKLDTKIELIIRGWAYDDRIILGCLGERVQKCYPEDKEEYRNALKHYYYGTDLEPESRRIESGPTTDIIESFKEKYDAVVGGTIVGCMGHKESYPIRYQCEIQVDSYIKYNGEKTGQLTVIAYRDKLNEDNQGAIFGLEYHEDENYYEIIESGEIENENR